MMTETNKQSVADAMDAIFGEGTAEEVWQGESLETARRPWEPPPDHGYSHSLKLKVTGSGRATLTHPAAPVGNHGGVRTVRIHEIPPGVPASEVVRRYNDCVDLAAIPVIPFARLKPGAILR